MEGPFAKISIKRKLYEMDEIIRKIYSKLKKNDLLIVLSDHGMANEGGHGGSSEMEISTPVIFISNMYSIKPINDIDIDIIKIFENIPIKQQNDLVSTISCLFNLPIPKHNRGIMFINEIMNNLAPHFDSKINIKYQIKSFQCLCKNILQLNHLLNLNDIKNEFESINQLFISYLANKYSDDLELLENLKKLNFKLEDLVRTRLNKEQDTNSIDNKQAFYLILAIISMLIVSFFFQI
jgi:predicted AlkP superfamily pyrophosphatase or phosphodiesterase